MLKNKYIRDGIIIAVVVLATSALFFTIFTVNAVSAKKKMENFNIVLGKTESGNNKENIRYASLSSNKELVEIREKMFVAQVSDVYINPEDYIGRTIKLEGIFKKEDPYSFVVRYGPGCCGDDANVGFEVAWDSEQIKPYPAIDSWVEAIGVLKTYKEAGYASDYLYLDLVSLNVLNERGAEIVWQ